MPGEHPFEEWIGRQRVTEDTLTLERAQKLAATLDQDQNELREGAPLPHGWHWIYFNEAAPRSSLADDGHERRGDFLPPIPLPRRMWAGGRLRFLRPMPIGAKVRRESTVRSIELKEGRSGSLAFVTVEHQLSDAEGVALEEEQDIVYLERASEQPTPPPSVGRPDSAASGEAATRRLGAFTADEVTLFRFSALTFNGHRIHYDRSFAREVEHYPDIVVHGPLLALLLLEAGGRWAEEHGGGPRQGEALSFQYRALQPVFANEPIDLCGVASAAAGADRVVDLWAEHTARGLVTRAEFRIAS